MHKPTFLRLGNRSPTPPAWIEISGFKCLRNSVRLHLRPLTLLAGANSSGKSSVMQPLLMMKQTLEAAYDPGALLLDGPHVRFTSPDEFLSRGKRRDDFADAVEVVFGPLVAGIRRAEEDGRDSPALRFLFRPNSRKKMDFGLSPVGVAQEVDGEWVGLSDKMSRADFQQAYAAWDPTQAKTIRDLPEAMSIRQSTERFSSRVVAVAKVNGRDHHWYLEPMELHYMWLSSILHLPGLRGHRERRYEAARVSQQGSTNQVPGPFTAYVASMLVGWQDEEDDRMEEVNASMRALGLTWKVKAHRINAAEVELRVGRTPSPQQGGASDMVSIADVGFGVSQVLPVIVALATAQEGQLVYIEQPELHLHPRAQHAMGGILAAAANRGVRVVVETHSRMILRAIQTEVAKPNGLSAEDVGLHWFRRDPDTGFTDVELADLDASGAFGDWPVDFSEAEADADDSWLDAVFASGG